jgi:transcriptional regulator
VYVPSFNEVSDEAELRAMVAAVGSAELITTAADGYPRATLLPVIWEGSTVIAHFARANPHWETIAEDAPVLLVCAGSQAYVSPTWYAAKAEHGRVVPTWNYSAVHLTGRARVHDDVKWVRAAVTALTDLHEAGRDERWHVTDAPGPYIDGQLRGIVGVEIAVEKVEGKAKLSQNRSEADRRGVVAGLSASGSAATATVAERMRNGLA